MRFEPKLNKYEKQQIHVIKYSNNKSIKALVGFCVMYPSYGYTKKNLFVSLKYKYMLNQIKPNRAI